MGLHSFVALRGKIPSYFSVIMKENIIQQYCTIKLRRMQPVLSEFGAKMSVKWNNRPAIKLRRLFLQRLIIGVFNDSSCNGREQLRVAAGSRLRDIGRNINQRNNQQARQNPRRKAQMKTKERGAVPLRAGGAQAQGVR